MIVVENSLNNLSIQSQPIKSSWAFSLHKVKFSLCKESLSLSSIQQQRGTQDHTENKFIGIWYPYIYNVKNKMGLVSYLKLPFNKWLTTCGPGVCLVYRYKKKVL